MKSLICAAAIALAIIPTRAEESPGIYQLVWHVNVRTPEGGSASGVITERQLFKDRQSCVAFARAHTPRVADWVRGHLNADWDVPVAVKFECDLPGNPA